MFDGLIDKLKIIPFEDAENVQAMLPGGPPFIVQFNPEGYTVNTEFELGPEEPAQGDTGEEAKFRHIKPQSHSFEILLDGTGASGGPKLEVLAQLALFKKTVGFTGKIHRPNFLLIHWGAFVVTCALESYSVNYKLFKPSGIPLRAVITAIFKEHKPKKEKELEKALSSPDLTHLHKVKDNQHLSFVSQMIYKDTKYYYHIADANKLNNLRQMKTGKQLVLPPLEIK